MPSRAEHGLEGVLFCKMRETNMTVADLRKLT
jgi:hypothetical protein